MLEWAYRLLSALAVPAVLVRLWIKGVRQPSYRERLGERLGWPPPSIPRNVLWIHCVSVGETIAAAPVIQALVERSPQTEILVTTTTPTGSIEVRRRLGSQVHHCYAPYDFGFAVNRFLGSVQPEGLILVETELWPNLLRAARTRDIPVWLINARLSEVSAGRYQRLGKMSRTMIGTLSGIACQYDDTAARFRGLGARDEQLEVTGNIKFDLEIPDRSEQDIARQRCERFGDRPCWLAASTHSSEERILLEAHRMLLGVHRNAVLVLVPRHPHRAMDVQALCHQMGLSSALWSESSDAVQDRAVLIADQLGTLMELYALADLAFVGGSLDATGGHNPIEAAAHRLPILMGPERRNFAEICRRFEAENAILAVSDAESIVREVDRLLANPRMKDSLGSRAWSVVQANRGAGHATILALERWLDSASSRPPGRVAPPDSRPS